MRIVYVSHNGIGTALVRSQVLPYLRGLIQRGHDVRLITFDRGEPYPTGEFPRDRWIGQRPLPGRSLAVKLADIVRGAVTVTRHARDADVLHARSYIPAAMCWIARRIAGTPYIFDMRGFLGEEFVDAGQWSTDDLRYRGVRLAEGHLLQDASEIVVLTNAAERRLRSEPRYRRVVGSRPVTVVPCAVDLRRFAPVDPRELEPTLVYAGSLGTWYELDAMVRVFAEARRSLPALRFRIVNRDDHGLVRDALARHRVDPSGVDLRAADPTEMPRLLASAHVGIALLKQVRSKIGSSPIKLGEYLACGLPVVVNRGLGDADAQISESDCGWVLDDYADASIAAAGTAVARLVTDGEARTRARSLAERVYDLDGGIAAYDGIYTRQGGRTP